MHVQAIYLSLSPGKLCRSHFEAFDKAHLMHEVVGQRGQTMALGCLCQLEGIKLPAGATLGQEGLNLIIAHYQQGHDISIP